MRATLALSGKLADEKLSDHISSVVFYAPDGVTARITATIAAGVRTVTRNL